MMRKGKTDHNVLQKFVDLGGTAHLVKAAKKWGIDSYATCIVTIILLTKQECVHEAANAGVITILEDVIINQKHESTRINALRALSTIVMTSDEYRDKVLQTELMKHAVSTLKSQFLRPQYYYLYFLRKMIHPGQYMPSIEYFIDLELISLLVSWTGLTDFRNSEDREIPTCAIKILTDILHGTKYKKSIVEAVIDADVASNMATYIENEVSNDGNVRMALDILINIAKSKSHSSLCRDKVMDSGIVNLLSPGIMSSSIGMQSCWIDLVYYLVMAGSDNQDVIKTLVNSGVVDTLVNITENESDNHIKRRVYGILRMAKTQYSEKQTNYVVLLHKRKSWLMVAACREEVNESLKAALSKMKKTEDAE